LYKSIMLLCLMSCCLISCCIVDKPDDDADGNDADPNIFTDDLREFEFELSVILENETYQGDESSMILEIVLISQDDWNIEIETYQIYYPEVVIIDPNGYYHTLFHGNISVEPHYQVIKKNEEIRTELDLKTYSYWNGIPFITSVGPMNWEIKGSYQCFVNAYNIESNIEDFDIL